MLPAGVPAMFGEGAVLVPLVWQGASTGFILLGPERTGAGYGPEDLLFMATIGAQAAGSIATARISETLARSREFDAFSRLTSYVIHDVKNCVSALSLLARNALTHADDPEFQRDSIRTLSRTVDRMRALLEKLQSPATSTERALEPVDLAAILEEVVQPLRSHERLHIVTDFRPVDRIPADPDALLRAFENLVKNAVEAIPGTGTVTVSVHRDDDHAVVAIADTGRGMAEDFVRTALFTPFRSSKNGGWGVGLYQARDIIRRHGGTIAVATAPGQGTTFQIRLPHVAGGRTPLAAVATREGS
jgi:putative PEP-CTERM system histidine kinase